MIIIETIAALRETLSSLKHEGKQIGFVPTMGALHQGHLALVRSSIEENQITVVSIFLNPIQFEDKDDFNSYPVSHTDDLKALEDLEHVDFVFLPKVDEILPPGSDLSVNPGLLSDKMCGMSRPGHFRGVLTVVLKLFNMVQPDTAYFGAKDFQQFTMISKMVSEFNIPISLRMLPTVREDNGLAMSSRNKNLSAAEFEEASIIYQTLERGKRMIDKGETSTMKVIEFMMTTLIEYSNFEIDYLVICNPLTLEDINEVNAQTPYCIAVATFLGKVRLIDNIVNIKNK
jgi:pantoate--beta-alanine ligase